MRIPAVCQNLEGGLIIDLPQTEIKVKLNDLVDVDNFESDEVLIEYLRNIYLSIKANRYDPNSWQQHPPTIEQLNQNENFQNHSAEVLTQV